MNYLFYANGQEPYRLSDYENFTISTNSANPTIVPYDGFITWRDPSRTSNQFFVNGVAIATENTGGDHNSTQTTSIPVLKGDICYCNGDAGSHARWYKWR